MKKLISTAIGCATVFTGLALGTPQADARVFREPCKRCYTIHGEYSCKADPFRTCNYVNWAHCYNTSTWCY